MAQFVSKVDETVRLFRNPVLEYFSHIHPLTPLLVYGPVVVWFSFTAVQELGATAALAGATAGLALWSLVEYWFHRLLFHYQPRSAWGKRLHFLMHGIHHAYPQDRTRLVMPLPVSVPLAVLFYVLFRCCFGVHHSALFAGFALGYLAYDSLHYAIHHFPMRNRAARWLKRHHLRHHFTDERAGYGVSSPVWDWVFGTLPDATKNPLPADKRLS
jgi:sterol desaturase/sphingolipid hydroxylase (fatty acid hydroxylase superfamily)